MPPDDQIEYNWIDGVERLEKHVPGGYHPAMIGDLLDGRYRIVDKLGFGGYSTIWLCQDIRLRRYVAVKVGISTPSLPRREPGILRDVSSSKSASGATHAGIGASDAVRIHLGWVYSSRTKRGTPMLCDCSRAGKPERSIL